MKNDFSLKSYNESFCSENGEKYIYVFNGYKGAEQRFLDDNINVTKDFFKAALLDKPNLSFKNFYAIKVKDYINNINF